MTAVTVHRHRVSAAEPRAHPAPARARRVARRVRVAAPARRHRPAQDAQGVHPPHHPAALPPRLRVHLRVPEDRAGRRWWQRGRRERVLDRARRGRRRPHDHVPGRAVGRAPDGAGVRVHARDRRPRARAVAHLDGRDREGGLGRAERALRRVDRVPDRRGRPGDRGAPPRQLAGAAHVDAARLLHVRRARAHLRHVLRPADRAAPVRHRGAAAHVPRRARTTRGRRSRRSSGSRSSSSSTRSCTCARGSGPRSRPSRT